MSDAERRDEVKHESLKLIIITVAYFTLLTRSLRLLLIYRYSLSCLGLELLGCLTCHVSLFDSSMPSLCTFELA